MILTDEEKIAAIADVQEIILSTESLATIFRPIKTEPQADDVMGEIESSATTIATNVPVEFLALPPEQIIQEGHDRKANVLPATNVEENDFIVDQASPDVRYRITNIVKHNLFGAVTHFELRLERKYEENTP